MEAARANLRLLNPDGEVRLGDPESYAEALVELHNARAKAERLEVENGHLGEALKREVVAHRTTKAKLHKDLRLHKDYATVERLWGKYREFHPRSPEEVPDDYLKMGLAQVKALGEDACSRALDGARRNPPVNRETGTVYDGWANVFRNTGNTDSYVKRADEAEGRAHRDRDPGVRKVLAELLVSSVDDLAARCECGHLVIEHLSRSDRDREGLRPCCYEGCGCEFPDDLSWRADRWMLRQEGRVA